MLVVGDIFTLPPKFLEKQRGINLERAAVDSVEHFALLNYMNWLLHMNTDYCLQSIVYMNTFCKYDVFHAAIAIIYMMHATELLHFT